MKKLVCIISAIVILVSATIAMAWESEYGTGTKIGDYYYWQKYRQNSDDVIYQDKIDAIHNPSKEVDKLDVDIPKGYGEMSEPDLSKPFFSE